MGLYQVRVRYDGFPGSPGFNTLYFIGSNETATQSSSVKAAAAHGLVAAFITAYAGDVNGMPAAIDWTVESDIPVRDFTNGQGLTSFSVAAVSGSGTPAGELLPSANGLVVTWRTAAFGPRGRGRSFMPPGTENQSNSGLPAALPVSVLLGDAQDFVTAADANVEVDFVVWHRPTPALPLSGSVASVDSASVRAQWGILRSRRD